MFLRQPGKGIQNNDRITNINGDTYNTVNLILTYQC